MSPPIPFAFVGPAPTVPAASDVRQGTAVGFGGTGTLVTGGGASADPGVSNVRSGVGYEIGGTNLTGTLAAPSLADTKIGVAGDGGTGTYDGSDRWSDPGVSNVLAPVAYKANSTSDNRTGTASGGTVSGYPLNESGGTGAGGAPITLAGVAVAADALRVVDPAGNPIANASVIAYAASDTGRLDPLDSTATGSDGRWDAPLRLASGSYSLVIGFPGYVPVVETVLVVP